MKGSRGKLAAAAAIVIVAAGWWYLGPRSPAAWSDADLALLASLSIDSLPPLAPDPSNAVADDEAAARFGQRLFFDNRLSRTGGVSCASCHQPERRFTDGLKKGRGIGVSGRNTHSIVGSAYSPWQYWDGRRDSQWSQALSPMEDPAEQGGNRMQIARLIASDDRYRHSYESLFGPLPDFSDMARFPADAAPVPGSALDAAWNDMNADDRRSVNRVFANLGKSIAAYERRIQPGPSRFDAYVRALVSGNENVASVLLSREEILGLQLFVGDAQCTRCHNGPLFTNHEFHNTGMLSAPGEPPDRGRIDGFRKALDDPFNCLGEYSDDPDHDCAELVYARRGIELLGAMRTPSLRNLVGTAPYGHKGQQETLGDVLAQYNESPTAMIGHNEAEFPLGLGRRQLKWLEAFLLSLDAPLATEPEWLDPPGQ